MDSVACPYCGAALTQNELRNIAEADELSVEAILEDPTITEIMCDKCAEGN